MHDASSTGTTTATAGRGAVSHSNDQVFLAPVFHAGRPLGVRDGLGAFLRYRRPAPRFDQPRCTDIFQEGIIIPPRKLIDAGVTNDATRIFFYRNSRYPRPAAAIPAR